LFCFFLSCEKYGFGMTKKESASFLKKSSKKLLLV